MTHVPNNFLKMGIEIHSHHTQFCLERKPSNIWIAPDQNNKRYPWWRKDGKILMKLNEEMLQWRIWVQSLAKLAPRWIKQFKFYFYIYIGDKKVRKKIQGWLFLFLPIFTCLKYHTFTFTHLKCHAFIGSSSSGHSFTIPQTASQPLGKKSQSHWLV